MALILLVEDEPSLQLALADTLADAGHVVTVAGTVAAGLSALRKETPDLVLCDLRLPDGSGLTVLDTVVSETPDVPVVVLTAYGTVAGAVEALHAGASEYLTKPFDETQLMAMIARHIELRRLRRRVADLEGSVHEPIGGSTAFRQAVDLARTVARVVGFDGALRFDASKPDGTPRKLLDLTRLRALGWRPATALEDGIGRAYADFLQSA